ncbi:MAG: TIR domain-containing protein [Clostridia bacterium]|nr:TIR domain-containing protein [Clostridia bacterium]
MKEVFISYKTEEFDEANWVRSTLEHNGISCWMAPMSIPGGSSYAVEIPQAIKGCKVFVLILSEKSQSSKWVPRELDQAINEGKIIMPFMLENCALKDDFNFYLTNVQRYNAYESKAATMEKMILEIKAVLGQKPLVSTPAEEEPETPAAGEKPKPEPPKPEEPKPESPKPELPGPEVPKPPVGPPTPPKAQAPKAKSRPAAKSSAPRQKKKLLLFVAIGVVTALVVGILLSVITSSANTIVIAGETFKKSDYSVVLEDKTLTQNDILQFEKFDDLNTISLTGCALQGSLRAMGQHNLTTLVLARCGVTQEQLKTLELSDEVFRLDLSGNQEITDLAPLNLANKNYLYELHISDTGVTDITPVGTLPKLEKLYVNRLGLLNLEGLENCIYLQELHAVGNALTTLEGLENTSKLARVYLNDNQLTDITPLARSAETLTVLQVNNNALASLDVLKACTALKYLSADKNKLTGIEELPRKSLSGLSVADNQLTAIEKPWGLVGDSVYMDVSGNRITERVVVTGDKGRIQLDMSDNPLVDYAYATDHYYSNLFMHGLPAEDDPAHHLEILMETIEGSRLVIDYGEGMEKANLAENDKFNEVYVVDCPLSAQVAMQELLGSYRVQFVSADEAAELAMSLPYEMQYDE